MSVHNLILISFLYLIERRDEQNLQERNRDSLETSEGQVSKISLKHLAQLLSLVPICQSITIIGGAEEP